MTRVLALAATVLLMAAGMSGSADRGSSVVYLEIPSPFSSDRIGTSPSGTGFVISSDAKASYILTAAHVAGCDTYGNGCQSTLDVRFSDDPKGMAGDVDYAGASNATDDYAIVRVARGNLQTVSLGNAATREAIYELGYPDASERAVPASLPARLLQGTVTGAPDSGRRLLMRIATTHGDSGAPIFDAGSNMVIGLVHGAAGDAPDAERFGIGPASLRYAAAVTNGAIATAKGDDRAAGARLLYLNARAVANRYNFLFSHFVQPMSAPMQGLQTTQRRLFLSAMRAGSLEAAEYVASSFFQMDIMISQGGVLERLDGAVQRGDAAAALALSMYFQRQVTSPQLFSALPTSAEPQQDALRYLNLAANGGNPYAMDDLAGDYSTGALGLAKSASVSTSWRKRAEVRLEALAANGDADAAAQRATDYEFFDAKPSTAGYRANLIGYLRRAADLGSTTATSNLIDVLLIGDQDDVAEAFRRAKIAVDGGAVGKIADQLGLMYEFGKGTPVDRDAALAAYVRGGDLLAQKLATFVPDARGISDTLEASKGYAAAAATTARIYVPIPVPTFRPPTDPLRDNTTIANGVVVHSDGRTAIIATAAFNLGCDSFGDKCLTPASIEIGSSSTAYGNVRIVRAADTSVENGVVLLQVDAPNAASAALTNTIPRVVMTAGSFSMTSRLANGKWLLGKASWGVLLGATEDRRVIDLALPSEFLLGSGIFDVATGELAGIYTDPYNALHATGPATIALALREAGVR